MKVTVELQPPMLYMTRWTVIALVCALAAALMIALLVRSIRREPKKAREVVKDAAWREKQRRTYAAQLDAVDRKLQSGGVSEREAFQEMSGILRMFVFEMTGIHVHEFTLTEIRKVGIPAMPGLVSSYYKPEFAPRSRANAQAALAKTKEVILSWS